MDLKNRAIFLDRDGVINKVLIKKGRPFSPRSVRDFKLTPGIVRVLYCFRRNGFLNIITTNQPDIARGFLEENELNKMHAVVKENLPIDAIMVCPHDDRDNCSCRKPKSGMLFSAADKFNIDLNNSFIIGDNKKDAIAGRNAGCTTIIIDAKYNKDAEANYRIKRIKEAIGIVLSGRLR